MSAQQHHPCESTVQYSMTRK